MQVHSPIRVVGVELPARSENPSCCYHAKITNVTV